MKYDTPDFEHCKQLKEAGWKKKTSHIYILDCEGNWKVTHTEMTIDVWRRLNPTLWYPAPFLTELFRELETVIDTTTHGFALTQRPWVDKHSEDEYAVGIGSEIEFRDPNPCNAAAKLWIWKEKRKHNYRMSLDSINGMGTGVRPQSFCRRRGQDVGPGASRIRCEQSRVRNFQGSNLGRKAPLASHFLYGD